jgi:putative membrane protein
MRSAFLTLLIGLAMGAANVIPGVSGGTIAFVTGIYERLLNALKAFDMEALRLLSRRQWADLLRHVDFFWLAWLALGVVISFLSLARFLQWALAGHESLVFAFFFGLIIASVVSVGTMVKAWSPGRWLAAAGGAGFAVGLAVLTPAAENPNLFYLFLCGIAAVCSMILPGISGSFVLLLMGNYPLVLRAVNERDLVTLVPVALGGVAGLMMLARFLSWLFRRFHDLTVAAITGFVAGSLLAIWPWKTPAEVQVFEIGGKTKEKILSYQWNWPDWSGHTGMALGLMLAGILLVVALEVGFAKPKAGGAARS